MCSVSRDSPCRYWHLFVILLSAKHHEGWGPLEPGMVGGEGAGGLKRVVLSDWLTPDSDGGETCLFSTHVSGRIPEA